MSSFRSIRGFVTSLLVLATLLVLAITTTRHHGQQTYHQLDNDQSIDQSIEQSVEQSTHHTFHTKQVNDVSTDLLVISRPPATRWRQVDDTSVTTSTLHPNVPHTFHWIFPSRNMDWVTSQLSAVSDPNNARYGAWMSKADVDAMTQPEPAIKQSVVSWLIDQGLTDEDWDNLGTMLSITAPISLIESMFHTTMLAYALPMHNSTDLDLTTMVIRTSGSISIPSSLSSSLAHITGLNDFPAISDLTRFNHTTTLQPVQSGRRRSRFQLQQQSNTPLPCSDDILFTNSIYANSALLARAYNYTTRATDTAPQTSTRYPAIINGLTSDMTNECFTQSDLNSVPSILGFSSSPRLAPGSAVCDDGEQATNQASSDIATLYSVVPTTTIGSFASNGDIAAIANMILSMSDATIPSVVAYSYSSYSDTDPSVAAADAALASLALRGVTFVVSAGVQGAPGPGNLMCEPSPDFPEDTPESSLLTAAYPASSPYVLSVGATDFLYGITNQVSANYIVTPPLTRSGLPPACNRCSNSGSGADFRLACQFDFTAEQSVNVIQNPGPGFSTGGGFANYDTRASLAWQRAAVDRYIDVACDVSVGCSLPDRALFSRSRRGFPDVSAYGSFTPFVINGEMSTQNVLPTIITSAAALWAGFITRMNEVSPFPMGFVNPYLYQMAQRSSETFNDITFGNNILSQDYYWANNPSNEFGTTCAGYGAAPGWDPVSGLGSPNLGRILEYIQANPNAPEVAGDPTITGFHGHTMQVHGTSGEYYNLISTPNFQYNAQFVFLSEGACTSELKNRTECWSHAGTYLGEVGLLIGGHSQSVVRVHVQAGSIHEGLSVTVYDEQSEFPSLLLESSAEDMFTHDLFTLTQPNQFTAVLTMDEFVITWHNSDQFVNQQVSMQSQLDNKIEAFITQQQRYFKSINQSIKRSQISPEHDTSRQLPHGLLGQSWSERSYDNQWKWLQGRVDDYVVTDGLFGTQFVYNRFVDQTQ